MNIFPLKKARNIPIGVFCPQDRVRKMLNRKIQKVFVAAVKHTIESLEGNVAAVKYFMQGNISAVVGTLKQIQRTTNAVEAYLSKFQPRFVAEESRQRKMLAKSAAMFVVKLNGMINGKKFA